MNIKKNHVCLLSANYYDVHVQTPTIRSNDSDKRNPSIGISYNLLNVMINSHYIYKYSMNCEIHPYDITFT